MGQASRRGSFEDRQAQAIERKRQLNLAIQMERQKRIEQEALAWNTMVWWQIEMTEARYRRIKKRELDMNMTMATLLGMAYRGSW